SCVILDGGAVVNSKDNEVAQLLGTGQRGSFGGHALLQITIGCDDVDVVVERLFASWSISVKKAAFFTRSHSHADRRCQTLAQRTGGDLNTVSVTDLRVARS